MDARREQLLMGQMWWVFMLRGVLAAIAAGERVLGEIVLKAQAGYARDGTHKYMLDIYNVI